MPESEEKPVDTLSAPFQYHVLVCTNTRPPGGKPSCQTSSESTLLKKFQIAILKNKQLSGKVLVSGTQCLGFCFKGPNVVVYPDGVWYHNVSVNDVNELVESHLENGIPLQRLLDSSST